MGGFLLELKLTIRGLRRRSWAVAAAAVSLALGFAVQIVVLSCVNSVPWRPLAVPEPDRVATIYGHSTMTGSLTNIAYPQLERLETLDAFDGVAAFTRFHLVLEFEQTAEKLGFEMNGVSGHDRPQHKAAGDLLDEEGELRQRLTIVGVARDAKYHTLWQQDIPYFYVSADDGPGGSPAIVVRSRASVEKTWQAIRETVQGVYPQAVVSSPSTVNSQLAELIGEQSYLAAFFGGLGSIALVVAAGGLMANLYLMVSQKTREIGIRQALGASRAAVLRAVLRQGLLVAAGGLLLGLAAGNRLEEWVRPLAPGTPEGDLWPLAVTFAVLLLVAIGSSLGPGLRASRIEPWKAIRYPE